MSDYSRASSQSDLIDCEPPREVEYPLNTPTPVPGTNEGVVKTVLTPGRGAHPPRGAQVSVHYVGRLTEEAGGAVFDSSRDRDEPFVFTLGKGQVIQGWDRGVATMRRGEKAELRCTSAFAYGAAGSPPKIPPNATLVFEVELLSWTRPTEDLSAAKDGSLRKRLVQEGVDYAKPEFESAVVADVGIFVGPDVDGDADADADADAHPQATPVWSQTNWSILLGETALPPHLETCLSSMRKGETAIFHVAPSVLSSDAVAAFGIPTPLQTELRYRVHVQELETTPTWGLNLAQRVSNGEARIEKGNGAFKAGRVDLAERYYRRALEFLGEYFGADEEEEEEEQQQEANEEAEKNAPAAEAQGAEGTHTNVQAPGDREAETRPSRKATWEASRVRAMGNLAQSLLCRGRYGEVIELSHKILALSPSNAKAQFRLAKALNGRQDWDEAIGVIDQLLHRDPANVEAKALRAQVTQERNAFLQKQKHIYKKMFS